MLLPIPDGVGEMVPVPIDELKEDTNDVLVTDPGKVVFFTMDSVE